MTEELDFEHRVKTKMDNYDLMNAMRQNKSLLQHYVQLEDWDKVLQLTNELIIMKNERIARIEKQSK